MNNFYDRKVQFGNRYKLKSLGNDIVELTRYEGTVYQEGTELNANNLNGIKAELDNKRDKSTKIKSSDLDTSSNTNKIKAINLSEEVLQQMAGNTPINAVPADSSITNAKLADGAITSTKLAGNTGRILTRDCINIALGTTITVTILKGHNLFFDNNNFIVAIQPPIEITNAETTTYCLYLNLNTSLLECKRITDVNVPNIKIATFLNNTSTPFVILYGNDEAIKVYNGDMQVFDKINSYQKGVISPIRKINILINSTSKTIDLAFLNGNTTVFANGISYSGITTKESLTYTVNALPFNLLYNIKTNKLFFSYANTDLRLVMGDNIIFICSFYTSGLVVDIASSSVHNILINGVDYFPIGSVDNTEINPSSTLWNDPEYVFGINKNVANIPLEQVGSRVIKGMVSTVCSPNSRWNQVYKNGAWENAYDDGKGGHIYEGFASDKSYRYTELLDYREDDNFPVCSVQVFQRNGSPLPQQFGWTRVGTDDYSKTSYGYVGGWQFRDNFAYASCPTRYRKRPLPTSYPSNTGVDIPLDSDRIIACDLNGDMRMWDYATKTWYKLVTEKELNTTVMINNRAIGIENPFIVLPNTIKNDSKIENGKLYQVKRLGAYTLDGTENWSLQSETDTAFRFGCIGVTMEDYNLDYANSNTNMLSDKGVCRWVGTATLEDGETIVIMGRNVKGFFVVISKTLVSSLATFKTYLASNNIKVYYQLANEVTIEII